jgi:hypothetical protein
MMTAPGVRVGTDMSYAEVTVIVDGAQDDVATFATDDAVSYADMLAYIAGQGEMAASDGLPTEVYVLWHDHPLSDQDCCCVQYVSNHHPDYSWNMEAGS